MRTLFVLFFVLISSICAATTLYVNLLQLTNPANNMYHTIAEAYAAAINDDVIKIYPGEYYLNTTLIINKSLTIIGTTQSSSKIITNNQSGFNVTTGPVIIQDLTFKSTNSNGIYFSGTCPTPIVRNCLFESCGTGIFMKTSTTSQIDNCIFRNCSVGINYWGNSYGSLNNCMFQENTTAIYFDSGLIYINIYNSIFIENSNCILRDSLQATYYGITAYNISYGNTSSNAGSSTANIIGIDPMLNNTTGTPYYNYFLTTNSPCIDAGNPDILYNDQDGTRNDIGIFGGQYPWGNGKPVVLDIQLNPNSVQQGGTFDIQSTGQTK